MDRIKQINNKYLGKPVNEFDGYFLLYKFN